MRNATLTGLAALACATATIACDAAAPRGPLAPPPAVSAPSAGAGVTGEGTASTRGATIDVDPVPSFTVHFDAAHGLLSLHAPSNLCGGGSVPIVDRRRLVTPSAIEQVIQQTSSAAEPVAVYRASSLAEAGFGGTGPLVGFGALVDAAVFCDFISGPALIAEGTVRRFGTLSNASFAIHWVGTLAGVDGRTYHLTELYQLGADAHDPNNPATFAEHLSKILLSPRP